MNLSLNYLLSLTMLVLLGGCATDNSRIDTIVTRCCDTGSIPRTFTVTARDIPAFLGPLMVSNFSVAFANIGMQPVEQDPELLVTLRYEQINLAAEQQRDDFAERVGAGDAERFYARIIIEVKDAASASLLWSAHVQRLHDVGPGDYMHTGVASIAIYEAFTQVLEGYTR